MHVCSLFFKIVTKDEKNILFCFFEISRLYRLPLNDIYRQLDIVSSVKDYRILIRLLYSTFEYKINNNVAKIEMLTSDNDFCCMTPL